MRSGHDVIREMFPDYLRGILSDDTRNDVDVHLRECEDCRTELLFLTDLVRLETPDPGELYWKTLPQKVKLTAREEKTNRFSLRYSLQRSLTVAATIVIIVLLALTYLKRGEMPDQDPYYLYPLTTQILDYDGITEKDIPVVIEHPTVYETYAEGFIDNSYHREFVSLSSKELECLYEALEKEQERGG
ncbi:MAG: zf-HC2 domain-containing protein [Nitrospirota bacterium]